MLACTGLYLLLTSRHSFQPFAKNKKRYNELGNRYQKMDQDLEKARCVQCVRVGGVGRSRWVTNASYM